MIEKAVIYNTIDRTGMCPEDMFNSKSLPIGVSCRVELTREQMKELFSLYDWDQVSGNANTNLFGEKLVGYMHKEMLKDVKNDRVIPFKEDIQETTIPKKYYIDAGIEEDLGNVPNAHWPYGTTDFIR